MSLPKTIQAETKGFFSTTTGHAIAGAIATCLLTILSAIVKDPSFAGLVAGIGGSATVVAVVQDLLDETVDNI